MRDAINNGYIVGPACMLPAHTSLSLGALAP
jgi:hypothetical protein